MKTNSADG